MVEIFKTVKALINRQPQDNHKEQRELKRAYYELFRSDSGQIVLADIMRQGHLDQSTYVIGDPHETSFREGKRRLALEILNMVILGPDEETLIKAMMANQTSEVFRK